MTPRPQKKRSRSASPFRDVRRQTKTTTSRASSPLHPAATAGKHRRDDSGDEREPKRGGAAMALKDRQQELSDEPVRVYCDGVCVGCAWRCVDLCGCAWISRGLTNDDPPI